MNHNTKYWNGNIYICECGKEYSKSQSLNAHFSHCEIHSNIMGRLHNRDYNHPNKGKMIGWDNKSVEELNDIRIKVNLSRRNNLLNGITIHNWHNKKHTEETKEKIRKAALENISNKFGGIQANFSVKACEYIDNLNKSNNWNLQHALNGGEVRIGNYFVDGYDEKLKIIFEYDEQKHYKDYINNVLKEKDVLRQNKILGILGEGWSFYRYNEKIDKFYKII